MSHLWSLRTGAQPQADNSVRFTVWAPRALAPQVRLLTGNGRGDYPLLASDEGEGFVSANVPNARAGDDYIFVLDDGRERPDPVSRWQPHSVHGPSRIVDPTYDWTDAGWRGVAIDELVIYELHVGTFTPEGTFAAIVPRLAELRALGINAIELMPVAQFPGERNWGYDGVDLYAVQHSYGGPLELKAFVDAAHEHGLGVVLDVVYNHIGPEGNYLAEFGPYFTDRYRTPWGAALNFDGRDSDPVRRFVIDNALYWLREYHIDGLRLDAVHAIHDASATHLLEEIAHAVHDQAARLGKSVLVIGESDLNDPRLLRPTGQYGYGLDAQWSDDFHHAVHAALSGERVGYYADFGAVALIADAMREPFVYDGRHSAYRRRRHGASSIGIPRSRFVVAIQNHDQVGNRPKGERLAAVLSPEKVRLAAALLLLSPYVPLLFMGEEYGETNAFEYFVSHEDAATRAAVLAGRTRELAAFGWTDETSDPGDPQTFRRSKLRWEERNDGVHAAIRALYRDLLALRRDEPLLWPDRSRLSVTTGDPGWITLLREPLPGAWSSGDCLLAVFNCTDQVVSVPIPDSSGRAWTVRVATDAAAYGGRDEVVQSISGHGGRDAPKRLTEPATRTVRMPAWSAALYAETPGDPIDAF